MSCDVVRTKEQQSSKRLASEKSDKDYKERERDIIEDLRI